MTETAKFPCPAVYRDNSHTAIVVRIEDKEVTFIPMATLNVEVMRAAAFHAEWKAYGEYPVKRAAELYIGAAQYRPIPDKARKLLEAIVADKALDYATFQQPVKPQPQPQPQPKGTTTMAKTPAPAAKKAAPAAAKTAASPFEALVKGTPAKAAAPAAKKAPAAPAKAPAKAAAPAAKKATSAPAPAKAAAKDTGRRTQEADRRQGSTAPVGRSKIDDNAKHKVGDTSSVKRGFLAEFVEKAQSMKTFTRATLEAHWGGRAADAKMGTYFPYCLAKGIIVPV